MHAVIMMVVMMMIMVMIIFVTVAPELAYNLSISDPAGGVDMASARTNMITGKELGLSGRALMATVTVPRPRRLASEVACAEVGG